MKQRSQTDSVHDDSKAPKPGLRALAKKASQDKIVMAARKLFAEQGYDASTLRQIAKEAGLGLTTLFNHIRDKRELIYLIFDEEVSSTAVKAQAATRPWQTFQQKVLTISAFYFKLFSTEPVLSRILLSEILQQTPGLPLEKHLALRDLMIQSFEQLAMEAQGNGQLRPELNPRAIARSIHFAFTGASRWWITEPSPDWRSGQGYFEEIVELLAVGFNVPAQEVSGALPGKPQARLLAKKRKLPSRR